MWCSRSTHPNQSRSAQVSDSAESFAAIRTVTTAAGVVVVVVMGAAEVVVVVVTEKSEEEHQLPELGAEVLVRILHAVLRWSNPCGLPQFMSTLNHFSFLDLCQIEERPWDTSLPGSVLRRTRRSKRTTSVFRFRDPSMQEAPLSLLQRTTRTPKS